MKNVCPKCKEKIKATESFCCIADHEKNFLKYHLKCVIKNNKIKV